MLLFLAAPLHVTPGYDFAAEEAEAASASWRMTGRDEKKTDLPLAPWGWGTLTGRLNHGWTNGCFWWGKLPSGKHTKNYGKSQFSMGKSPISMVIFNSYVKLLEGMMGIKIYKYQLSVTGTSLEWCLWLEELSPNCSRMCAALARGQGWCTPFYQFVFSG